MHISFQFLHISKGHNLLYLASKTGVKLTEGFVECPNISWNSNGIWNGTPTRNGPSNIPTENF